MLITHIYKWYKKGQLKTLGYQKIIFIQWIDMATLPVHVSLLLL